MLASVAAAVVDVVMAGILSPAFAAVDDGDDLCDKICMMVFVISEMLLKE